MRGNPACFLKFKNARQLSDCIKKLAARIGEGWSTTVEEAKSLEGPLILSDIPVHRVQASTVADVFDPRSRASGWRTFLIIP
jgi:hypothetical protein